MRKVRKRSDRAALSDRSCPVTRTQTIIWKTVYWLNNDMIGKTGMVDSFSVSLSSSFFRKKRKVLLKGINAKSEILKRKRKVEGRGRGRERKRKGKKDFFPFLFLSLPLPLPSTFRLRFKISLFAFIPFILTILSGRARCTMATRHVHIRPALKSALKIALSLNFQFEQNRA